MGYAYFGKSLLININSFSQGHIDCLVKHEDKKWRFTGLYENPDTNLRDSSWTLIKRLIGIHELQEIPWIMRGDFNEIFYDNKKWGGNRHSPSQTEAFRNVINDCNMQSLHCEG